MQRHLMIRCHFRIQSGSGATDNAAKFLDIELFGDAVLFDDTVPLSYVAPFDEAP